MLNNMTTSYNACSLCLGVVDYLSVSLPSHELYSYKKGFKGIPNAPCTVTDVRSRLDLKEVQCLLLISCFLSRAKFIIIVNLLGFVRFNNRS